ncbi:hypothetical protein DIPPA_07738 [Diplonema papillatum]|nr:hypothetical protein DIPPA_07738 [Diplonema papillatum]
MASAAAAAEAVRPPQDDLQKQLDLANAELRVAREVLSQQHAAILKLSQVQKEERARFEELYRIQDEKAAAMAAQAQQRYPEQRHPQTHEVSTQVDAHTTSPMQSASTQTAAAVPSTFAHRDSGVSPSTPESLNVPFHLFSSSGLPTPTTRESQPPDMQIGGQIERSRCKRSSSLKRKPTVTTCKHKPRRPAHEGQPATSPVARLSSFQVPSVCEENEVESAGDYFYEELRSDVAPSHAPDDTSSDEEVLRVYRDALRSRRRPNHGHSFVSLSCTA